MDGGGEHMQYPGSPGGGAHRFTDLRLPKYHFLDEHVLSL